MAEGLLNAHRLLSPIETLIWVNMQWIRDSRLSLAGCWFACRQAACEIIGAIRFRCGGGYILIYDQLISLEPIQGHCTKPVWVSKSTPGRAFAPVRWCRVRVRPG